MSGNYDERWKKSVISLKYPTNRDINLKTTHSWIEGRRADDNAEGLWRIHDSIYDLTNFIDKHPGGPFWLKTTKGMDITEAFEAHHLSTTPEKMLEKFKVKDALKPRNITLTLKDNGFYKTLKSRIREKLKSIDYTPSGKSDMINTSLIILTFLLSIQCVTIESYIFVFLAGLSLCWTIITAHNYFHRKDNWRMYTFNLSLMNYADWRISHAISHHLYPNSFHDMELSMYEPYLCWVPNPYIKNWIQRYLSHIYGPILVYPLTFIFSYVIRMIYSYKKENIMQIDDLIGLSLPLAMYLFSGQSLYTVIKFWLLIVCAGSFIFGVIGLNAAHHHPEIYHDGDTIRDDRDWGLYELDTIIDRADLKGSQFLVLTHFGDHALHHLFPTLDHGVLPQLYPILYETIEEFKGQIRECRWLDHIIGQHKQIIKIEPNPEPPGSGIKVKR